MADNIFGALLKIHVKRVEEMVWPPEISPDSKLKFEVI